MIAPYECYKQGTLHNLFVFLNNSYAKWSTLARFNTVQQRGKVPDLLLVFCSLQVFLFHLKKKQHIVVYIKITIIVCKLSVIRIIKFTSILYSIVQQCKKMTVVSFKLF